MAQVDDAAVRRELNEVHSLLLRVHKALIDHEKERYAQAQRPLGTPLQFLQLLLTDPRFAWLRPLSELIVQVDETASVRGEVDRGEAAVLMEQARELLTPVEEGDGFPQQYYHAIQESPGVAAAHEQWKRAQS